MKKQTCPYLGMQQDQTTALDFPSEGNFCHRAEPTAPVNKVHQQRYCLTADHYGCPVYRDARPGAMPPALLPPAEPHALAATVTNRLPGFLLPGIIIGVAVLGLLLWVVAPQVLGINRSAIPNTGEATPGGDTSFNLFSFGDTRDETWTPFAPQFGGQTGEMIVPNCPQPAGWMPYITNPTDSLFRLSVVYGVPVEDLQRANCKDTTDTVILPGQVIYVPASAQGTLPSSIFAQEPTAFPTFTPARPGFVPQVTSTSSNGEPAPKTPVPSRTPTKRPVTNTPQPTITRVTATATRWVTPTRVTATPTRFVTPTKPPATLTPKPTNTRFPTRTPRPTRTPTPVPTKTPVPTNTPVPPTDTPEPTSTPRPTDPPPTDPPPTDTPRPTDPPPTEPPPTDTPRPTDPPPTDPPPTEPPPTEPPPTEEPPPVVTEPVDPTESDPPTEEATPTDPIPPGTVEPMRIELF